MVLVMSVEPGFGSQPFMPIAIDKVKQLKELKEKFNYNYLINIDGGINLKTIPLVKDYLDVAVSGSYICNSDNPVEAAKKLKEI
jgi:ribulose-phosphate 3-epimerase